MKMNLSGMWIVAIAFFVLAIYTFITKRPMNFWVGHKIAPKKNKKYKNLQYMYWYNVIVFSWLF